ncbi:LysR family transcriptional regulator [Streptomyces endophyticus]|uniref:LysR substrate-binding domain-containing protein n=1 Tax=Streptomyces endophyticus TaxID=714166 RepID=A0ABU6FHZ0_9ACTN|nr:LysR substrate-binding domain-containing protein [Streptomyces endophyticus]MEB8342466.1 LysR substrate-binding domain-containing protein [Streptomyces endophyticus]
MELRDIEIILTLADELHFGRTAERLHVSGARVSQAIKRQERRIGAPLFERTSRSVRLTPIGRRLAEGLRQGQDAINAAIAEATAAARGVSGTLTLGVMGALGHELRSHIGHFRKLYPECDVRLQEIHFSDPYGPLRRGEVDMLVLWLPVVEPDVTVGPVVLTEGRVLAVWAGHELSGHADVSLEDLAGRTVLDVGPDVPQDWGEAMLPARTPSGRAVPRGPRVRTFHEVLTQVAARTAVSPLNAHVLRYYRHPGVEFLPLRDAPPTEWALVWRTTDETTQHRAFAEAARAFGMRGAGS